MSIQTLSQKSNSTSNQVTEGGGHVVEDDLKKNKKNGRRPQKKWKRTQIFIFF